MSISKIIKSCCLTFCGLLFFTVAQAQPQIELEFDSMFGQHGFFQAGVAPNGFSTPTGISFNSENTVLVADRGNSQVQHCDLQGLCQWLGTFAFQFRNQPGTFDLPHGVATDRQGFFAVADEDNHAVQLCNLANGNCVYRGETNSENNPPATGFGRWAFPGDVAFDSNGRVFGLDTGNNRVQILQAGDLKFRGLFAVNQLGLNAAKGISIDDTDTVYIADTSNNRILICTSDGSSCNSFGSAGTAPGQFNEPIGIEVDFRGIIWVADAGNNRIQACNQQGACKAFGSLGTGQGEFDHPSDVAISITGRVAVVDSNNHRIQFFSTAPFLLNSGLNDAWFSPLTDGQGFFITVFPELGLISIAWFTYDTELPPVEVIANLGDAGHRWLTALGPINGHQAVLNIDNVSGGLFDTATAIVHTPDGTITIVFAGCNSALVKYTIPSINREGTIRIRRVSNDNIALCLALLP